jgi:hypothetical protein
VKRKVDTIIVGGGQAGLAVGYYLKQIGREFTVFDAADRPAHAWRDDRWDSFCLVTPNWTFRLPGAEYNGPDPQGYMVRDEIVRPRAFCKSTAGSIEIPRRSRRGRSWWSDRHSPGARLRRSCTRQGEKYSCVYAVQAGRRAGTGAGMCLNGW